jgi:hypothetical protein
VIKQYVIQRFLAYIYLKILLADSFVFLHNYLARKHLAFIYLISQQLFCQAYITEYLSYFQETLVLISSPCFHFSSPCFHCPLSSKVPRKFNLQGDNHTIYKMLLTPSPFSYGTSLLYNLCVKGRKRAVIIEESSREGPAGPGNPAVLCHSM